MKKFFEKNYLLKISSIFVLLAIILTWIVPTGYYQEGGMVTDEINRVGLTSAMQQGILSYTYFAGYVSFLLVLGAFYEVLSKTAGYQKMIEAISKKLKGLEKLFVLLSMLIFAVLTSLVNEYFPLLIFVPFVISIMNRLKIGKMPAFISTFGGILIGVLGATTSTKLIGMLNNVFQTELNTNLAVEIILFAFAYIALAFFTTRAMDNGSKPKGKDKDKKFISYDRFDIENVKSPKRDASLIPYIICAILIFVTVILAYMPWATFKVTVFDDITKWVNELSLFGSPIISYIFSEFIAFGNWDIFTIQYVMLSAILLIKIFGRVSFDELVESFGNGFKKIAPIVVVFLFVYATLVFTAQFPVIPVIIDKIASITKGFSSFFAFISAFITSIFGVEMQYVMSLSGTYFAAEATKHTKELAVIFQSAYGFAMFFMPTSAALMMGLSYLEIPYKEYLKFIWKFLVALLLVIAIIIIII